MMAELWRFLKTDTGLVLLGFACVISTMYFVGILVIMLD